MQNCLVTTPATQNSSFEEFCVAGVGFEPTTSWLCIPLRFSSLRLLSNLWSGLSLYHTLYKGEGICQLVSTPCLIYQTLVRDYLDPTCVVPGTSPNLTDSLTNGFPPARPGNLCEKMAFLVYYQ